MRKPAYVPRPRMGFSRCRRGVLVSGPRPARTPPGLGDAGRRLWRSVAADVAASGLELDARELRVLRDAARTADDLELIEEALAGAPAVVVGSTGQPRPQPLLEEARKARALIATLLRVLDLDDPAEAGHRGGVARSSTAARAAVMVRHHGNAHGLGGR